MTTHFSPDPPRVDVPPGPPGPSSESTLSLPQALAAVQTVPEMPRTPPPPPSSPPVAAEPREEPAPDTAQPPHAAPAEQGTDSDPVEALVRAAVAERPLEEVARLIELLEQSPQYADTAVGAMRGVGVDRSVEDVSRLVTLLTKPPRTPDGADETIRTAAEHRPLSDVTRLLVLLGQPPLHAHCAQEALRAAATGRPLEDLVQLIGDLDDERGALPATLGAAVNGTASHAAAVNAAAVNGAAVNGAVPYGTTPAPDALLSDTRGDLPAVAPAPAAAERPARPQKVTVSPVWARWAAIAALLVCAVAYFPLHRQGASTGAYGLALGVSGLCLALAVLMLSRTTPALLSASILLPAVLVAAQVLEDQLHSPTLTGALEITVAPPRLAVAVAALATLALLMAFVSANRQLQHAPRTAAPTTPAASTAE